MSLILKNSSSRSSNVVSEGILQYLLMVLIVLWWVGPELFTSTKPSRGIVLIELEDYMGPNDIEGLLNQFKSDVNIVKSSVEYISKDKAISMMEDEINSELLKESGIGNPFRDVVRFEMSNKINREDIITKAGIHEVFMDQSTSSSPAIKGLSLSAMVPLTIISLIILVLYLKRSIAEIASSNKEILDSFSTYGAESQYIKQSLIQSVTQVSLRAWFIAILLFVCTIYLLLGILDIKIVNISVLKLVACSLITFIVVLLLKRWMIGRTLKSIDL